MISRGPSWADQAEGADLIGRLRAGDAEAWQALSLAMRQQLRQLAASQLPREMNSRADASDVVQQTLLEASCSLPGFHGESFDELAAWLCKILENNANDAVRKHVLADQRSVRRETHFDDSSTGPGWDAVCAADQTSPSMAVARGEACRRLYVVLTSLPPRQHEAVRMRHLERRPLSEIAAALDCTSEAAAAAIFRGLHSMRDLLRDPV